MRMKKRITSAIVSMMIAVSGLMSLPVTAYDYPDPDGDGSISINDTVVIRMYLSAINEPTDLSALDFDENGVISAMDATTVQLYISGLWRNSNDV